MNENFELSFGVPNESEWNKLGVKFLQLNTTDIFCAPSQEKLVKGVSFINDFRNRGKCVYVHCKAGRTRSATLVACYLMQVILFFITHCYYLKCEYMIHLSSFSVFIFQKNTWLPENAVHFIQTKRAHILLGPKQWHALNVFYKNLTSNPVR